MSDSESDMSGIEEVIVTEHADQMQADPVPEEPDTKTKKPKTKKSKAKKSKDSDTKASEEARKKRQEELEDTSDKEQADKEATDSESENEAVVTPPTPKKAKKEKKKSKKPKTVEKREKVIDDDDSSINETDDSESSSNETVEPSMAEMVTKVNRLEQLLTELTDRIEDSGSRLSGKKSKKPKKPSSAKKPMIMGELTHTQVRTLISSQLNWGTHVVPKENPKSVFSSKDKLPCDIANLKLRELVENAITDEDLLEELKIEMKDDQVTTFIVTKIIKAHCKENDYSFIKEVIKDDGGTRNETVYNLTEGDFEDMFEEQVSS